MIISKLKATGFRNFASATLAPADGSNIFYGDNGSGKTNLLEAIFLLCLGRSHRGATDTIMVQDENPFYRVEGQIKTTDKNYEVAIAFQRDGRKKVQIDKVSAKLSELYDLFCAVAVGPEDSVIISGSPSARRMFLDIYLSQFRKLYLDDLTQYRKALSQRNAALKQGHDPSPFGTILAEIGARIILGRIQFLRELAISTSQFYGNISRGRSLMLRYEPSVPCDDDTDDLKLITERFLEKLDQVRIREQAVQTTLVGPHRDEIVFSIDNRPARSHGSQGEWRTAAIALKLAVYQMLREKRRMPPILLLDEIFAELDQHRVGGLIECFGQFGQLFLTTAVEPPAALSRDGRSFRIGENRIEGSQ